MTSTSVIMGKDGRSSSRVLKPPGGGHTDIFGGSASEQTGHINRKGTAYKSSVGDCLGGDVTVSNKATTPSTPVPVDNDESPPVEQPQVENGAVTEANIKESEVQNIEEVATAKPAEEKLVEQPTAVPQPQVQKTRVPPGGFSSGGFW